MKLTFFGAAKAVTGSCHCLEVGGKKILIDCGLQQGRDERDNRVLDFAPGYIDYVIVTHAHIDHSGRIPLLVKQGFHGKIVTTRLTGQLMSIMLRDSAHIQESDAQWQNQKGKRAGRAPVEPLYTIADAEAALELVTTCEYDELVDLCEGVRLRFVDAGHLLGSACVELWLTEDGVTKKIVFSGDLGNRDQPIIRDPQYIDEADYVVMESTYGDRLHEVPESYTEALAAIIDETFARGGNVIIPSFAVGRTQELLYFIREMKERGLVRTHPDFPVCVDSPLANEATRIFSGDLHGYLDEAAIEALKGGALFQFPGLTLTESSEESKALNLDKASKVIISASGMCDAGRIRHHLKHNLWRPESTIVFVGYQAEGSLGRALLEGASSVRLFGEEIAVRARIVNFKGMSSHADRDHLLAWVGHFAPHPSHVFVVHGDAPVTEIFAQHLRDAGISAHAAEYEEVYDLAADRMLAAGVPLPPKAVSAVSGSPAYRKLESAGQNLLETIRHNKGGTNKDLAQFEKELMALIQKWDR
ncbi:MAG: MBL fold metallo-hydrolase [Intestinimonas massiliensis]|uniref:MBL fold metallo-hydrolase RNA specificity domain-containing protein n=1 Tax=Intestinimonas TaxID=1392389 RepID=UPI0024303BE3|nr:MULTISPECIES: MBL fold metallo-hydrolase [Intestinimonas]MCI5562060.1 MBL fold metallo-hydrolase [Intestinimonas massiliensis (ex Afouda et al. 2020)]MDY5338557.1 MBL fold metallo-hydrolase [Intestinimonas sp.]